LIELLVVIVIIAILAVLLLPVLERAKPKGQQTHVSITLASKLSLYSHVPMEMATLCCLWSISGTVAESARYNPCYINQNPTNKLSRRNRMRGIYPPIRKFLGCDVLVEFRRPATGASRVNSLHPIFSKSCIIKFAWWLGLYLNL